MESSSFAHRLAISGALPRFSVGMASTVDIGFLAPLSGQAESWGLPGLHGCRIWEKWLNRAGGLLIGGRRYPIAIHAYDCGASPEEAREGAIQLVQQNDIKLMMMLGGDTYAAVADYLNDKRILTSTLLPSDLSPDSPYLIATSEVHPVYVVTGVDWLARTRPELALWALTRLEESGEGSSRSAADTDRMVATALAAGDSLAAIEAQLGRAQRLPTRGVEREQALARLLRLENSWSGVGAAALIARWTEFDREFPQSPARDSLAAGVAHALARREASDDALALLETAEGPLALEQRGWLLLGAGDVVGAKAALMAAAGGLEGRGTTSVLGAVAVLERLPGESAAEIAPALSEAHSGALGAALDRVARRLSVTPDSATSERATLHFVAAEIAGAGQDTASAEAHLDALLALPGDVVERPVALLALARMLSQRDEGIEQARAYLTQLILEHPQAAVVPEARRALEALGSEDQP
jgi:tetratricopeptide (TPR) repeat protein